VRLPSFRGSSERVPDGRARERTYRAVDQLVSVH
jgi:hypothetical protein